VTAPLADFTRRVLTRHGALVDEERDEINAVLPPALASILDVPEYQRFAFDRRVGDRQGLVVDYESPLLERFEQLIAPLGRIACVAAPPMPIRAIDASEIIARTVTLTNGVFRDSRVESGTAQYVGFLVQYELLADERISGMTEIWVNTTTGSVPRLPDLVERLLSSTEVQTDVDSGPVAASDDVQRTVAGAWDSGVPLARSSVEERLQDAMASLRRRRQREFAQLREYYEVIDQEIRARARRALKRKDDAALTAERSRLEATAQAFRSRAADLVDRYRVRVRLEPILAVVCTLPVHLVTTRVHRRSASRTLPLAWNAIDRLLELPRCDGCGTGTSVASLCDERVHVLCAGCQRLCETCGRAYCAACHARCPRQHT
jgi:hypothetical protein